MLGSSVWAEAALARSSGDHWRRSLIPDTAKCTTGESVCAFQSAPRGCVPCEEPWLCRGCMVTMVMPEGLGQRLVSITALTLCESSAGSGPGLLWLSEGEDGWQRKAFHVGLRRGLL